MIQALIYEKFNVFYVVNFSWQKAKSVLDRQDAETRKKWTEDTWPEILRLAGEKNAPCPFR